MNTTLTIKTNSHLIGEAKKLAKDMGISLTSVVNAYLRQFIKERKFSVSAEPMPTKEKMALLESISKDIDNGDFYGPFTNLDDVFKHLKI